MEEEVCLGTDGKHFPSLPSPPPLHSSSPFRGRGPGGTITPLLFHTSSSPPPPQLPPFSGMTERDYYCVHRKKGFPFPSLFFCCLFPFLTRQFPPFFPPPVYFFSAVAVRPSLSLSLQPSLSRLSPLSTSATILLLLHFPRGKDASCALSSFSSDEGDRLAPHSYRGEGEGEQKGEEHHPHSRPPAFAKKGRGGGGKRPPLAGEREGEQRERRSLLSRPRPPSSVPAPRPPRRTYASNRKERRSASQARGRIGKRRGRGLRRQGTDGGRTSPSL